MPGSHSVLLPRLVGWLAVLLMAVLLVTPPASAASLDPAFKWHTAETEHFIVYWYEGEELAAKRVLEIAEPIFARVTKAADWTPGPKTHLVLTDVTDTANGFAVTVPFNTIRIFVTAPQEGSSLDNYDDWLTMLLTHEFTHITHIDKIGGVPWLMRGIFGSIIDPNQIEPRWIVEGYATYQETALSTGGRGRSSFGQMIVRASVLENKFPPISRAGGETEVWPGGYIPYIFGVEFLQYLRETYGDENVVGFTERMAKDPFPFFPFAPLLNHNAKKSFGGKSFYELWRDWHASLEKKYGQEKEAVEAAGITVEERLTRHGGLVQSPRVSPDGKKVVYSMANGKGPASIRLMDVDGKKDKVLLNKYTADGFGWSPDGGTVAFGAEKTWKTYNLWSDIYAFSLDDDNLTRMTRGARARTPDYRPDGTVLTFVTNDVSNNDLAEVRVDQSVVWLTNNKDWTQYSTPRWRPDGKQIAVSTWLQGGYRDLVLVDPKGTLIQRITADRFLDRDPTWSPDGRYLIFSSDRTGIANLYAWEQATGRYFQVTNLVNGAFQPSVAVAGSDGQAKWVVYQGYSAEGYDVYRVPFDTAKWKEIGWTFDPEVYDATCKPPKNYQGSLPEDSLPDSLSFSPPSGMANGDAATSFATMDSPSSTASGMGGAFPQEPVPDAKEAEVQAKGGGRPKNRPDKNKDVDLSSFKPRKGYNPLRTMFPPRYWLPASVWITESGVSFGAFTGGTDPLFRHSWSAYASYNTGSSFIGGGARYFNDRWKPTFYGGGDAYVLDYGQSVYEYPDLAAPGSHVLNIHPTGAHYYERHLTAQAGFYYFWRSKYFLSARYLFDNRSAWTDIGPLTYDPFLPVRGNFAGPSIALTYDKTEQYRWSISPNKGYRVTGTLEAQEPAFGSDFRKEIGTADIRAYTPIPFLDYWVLGFRAVGGYAQGDTIRPSTFRLGGALGESPFSLTTPNYYSLRGYPFFAFGGERLMLGSAELRFPVWRANRGIGTWPFYLRTVHGGLFADSGQVWNADQEASADGFHTGVGAELRADTVWYYYFPLTIRLGYGFALNDDPAGYAPGDPYGLIFTLGTSF